MRLTRNLIAPATGLILLLTGCTAAAPARTLTAPESDGTATAVAGNLTCEVLGYVHGLTIFPPSPGTYPIATNTDNVTWYYTPGSHRVTWSSTFGIDAVIMTGGQEDARSYIYDPPAESFGESGLAWSDSDDEGPDLGHIEFCYDYEVAVSQDAHASFTRTYMWSIDRSITPNTWDLFTGDSGTSEYTVDVTRTNADSDFAVTGSIWIYNPDPDNAATITGVTNSVDGVPADVSCPETTVAPGTTMTCTYGASLPGTSPRTGIATVTTSGAVGGGSGEVDTVFGDPTTIVGSPTASITDTSGEAWIAIGDGARSVTYNRTFSCRDEGTHESTATVDQTGQSASASVTVNCHGLETTETAQANITRTWHWTIAKSADQTALTLASGQTFQAGNSVAVNATYTDGAWAVGGNISVYNPAPVDAVITDVSAMVSGVGVATVECGVSFPYTLAANGTLDCMYSAYLPDTGDRTSTATITVQNYARPTMTALGTFSLSSSADISFARTTINEVDECIDTTDVYAGDIGTVCADDAPHVFRYLNNIGPYRFCGEYTAVNNVWFVTGDSHTVGGDNWPIAVSVPCQGGCTLTFDYWKTHNASFPGGAPADLTWGTIRPGIPGDQTMAQLGGHLSPLPEGGSELSPFKDWITSISIGNTQQQISHLLTYYDAMWTPLVGRTWFILARAYIGAYLNTRSGASIPPEVQSALDQAYGLLQQYDPDVSLDGREATRDRFIRLASILDDYSNGITGPGSCSEDAASANN